jgi:recombination DNA repair RAD52 pathway protein
MSDRFYVIDAELTFAAPVSSDHQDDAELAVSNMATPSVEKPSLRWTTTRRALVEQLEVSASTSSFAIQAARDALRECVRESTSLPLRSFAALSVKIGARERFKYRS